MISPAVRTVLDLPLHRTLGLRLVDEDDPAAGVAITIGDLALNPSGSLHGGLVPLCLDVAAYIAVVDQLEPGTNAVTVNIDVSLISAVAPGRTVRFEAVVDRRGRSLVFVSARAWDGERLVATGRVVKSIVTVA